jgi:hypothetical protein
MNIIGMGITMKENHAALREKHVEIMPKRPKNRCLPCHALKSIDAMKQAKPLYPSTTTSTCVSEKY